MAKKTNLPSDANQLAKSIVDTATGNLDETTFTPDGKNAAAVALGRKGGKKGGPARAKALTSKQRVAIAKKAAAARWGIKKKG